MTYRVVKKVKGRLYFYEQESFRLGGRVHTRSRYLGPVEGGGSTSSAPSRSAPPARGNRGVAGKASSPPVRPIWADAGEGGAPPLAVSPKLDLAGHGISGAALEREHEQVVRRLQVAGLPVERFAPVRVGRGFWTNRRRGFRGTYVVTLARFGHGHRTKFKNQFSRALAEASLDLLKSHDPASYRDLETRWKKSFKRSQKALGLYLRAAARSQKTGRTLSHSLRFFGRFLPQARRLLPKPHEVGLVDYTERTSWRGDAVVLLARIGRVGYGRVRSDAARDLAAARKELAIATNMAKQKRRKVQKRTLLGTKPGDERIFPWSPYRRRSKIRRRKAIARLAAVEEMNVKIALLGRTLCRIA